MAPNKKCLALPSVVQLCAILLVLCKALSAAPAKDQGEKFLDLWPENSCTFPTELVMTRVQTLCDKSKLDEDYNIDSPTWQFVNTVCHTILNISSNICRVPNETLEKHNLTEDKLINYMYHDTMNVCVEVAGTAVTKIWAGLEFVVADNSTCAFVFDDLDAASKLLRLLYRLAWARHTLPPSPDVVWKNGFITFKNFWDSLNCTFPPPWAMETDVNHTCYNPPRGKPKSKPWEYQEKLCAALFEVIKSVCTDPDIVSGHGLKGLLDNKQFKVCDEALKLKDVVPEMASELSVFTDSPNMCTHLCVDDKHVTRMCKLLFFAMTVPHLQHLQHLMQLMLGSADSATHTTPADGGHSDTLTPPPDGGHSDKQTPPPDGGHSDKQTPPADGGHSDKQTPPADGGHSDTQTPPTDGGHSDKQTPPPDGGHSDTQTPSPDGGHSDKQTPPPDGGHSDKQTPPADGGHSDKQTPPPDGGHSDKQTPPPDGGHSDKQTPPPDGGHSDKQTPPADGGHSDKQTPPTDGGHSDKQTPPPDGGHSDKQTPPADGGHSDTHAASDEGGNSGDTSPKDEDQNTNPVAKTMSESLQSGSSVLLMVYIVTAICSVLLLYVLFHNRRRIIDCVLGRRESWQRHRDAERDGKYSPLDAAVEDFLSLDKAVTKSKTHVY